MEDEATSDQRSDGGAAARRETQMAFPSSDPPGSLPGPGPNLSDGDRVRPVRNRRRPLRLNDYTCNCIRDMADGYVRPLKPREVRVRNDDRFAIHYDDETAKKVMQSILDFHGAHASAKSNVGEKNTATPKGE